MLLEKKLKQKPGRDFSQYFLDIQARSNVHIWALIYLQMANYSQFYISLFKHFLSIKANEYSTNNGCTISAQPQRLWAHRRHHRRRQLPRNQLNWRLVNYAPIANIKEHQKRPKMLQMPQILNNIPTVSFWNRDRTRTHKASLWVTWKESILGQYRSGRRSVTKPWKVNIY